MSGQITLLLNRKDVPHLTGHRRSNLKRFEEQGIQVRWNESDLPPGHFLIHAMQTKADTNFHSRGDRGGSEEPIGSTKDAGVPWGTSRRAIA